MTVGIGCCQPGLAHPVYGKSHLQDVEENLGSNLGRSTSTAHHIQATTVRRL
jgi:hypothetical protein